MMVAIDTNILVRYLVNDDEVQAMKVADFLLDLEANLNKAFVSWLVVIELIWVLNYRYKISRADIIEEIEFLMLMPILEFENATDLADLLNKAKRNSFDLSDLLIAYRSQINNALPVMTFDKKAAKFEFFELLD